MRDHAHDPDTPIPHDRDRPRRIAMIGILVNTLLAAGKLAAGIFGHSFALVADAVESLVDIAGSALVWSAMRYGDRPADTEHPFGHGKAEALAALAVATIIILAGIGIAIEAIRQLITPHSTPHPFTLLVLIAVVVIKETLARAAAAAARRAGDSAAGHADAWHHRADAITSAFAFIGIAIAVLGGPGWERADDAAALLASFVIVANGLLLAREPYHELLDRDRPDVAAAAARIAMTIDGVHHVERSDARRSGRAHRVVMHVEVDSDMTVDASHRITGRIKAAIRTQRPDIDSVLIHIEPATAPTPTPQHNGISAIDDQIAPGAALLLVNIDDTRTVNAAARAIGPSGQLIIVLASPAQVASCRAAHPDVDVRLGETPHLPVADGAIDVAIAQRVPARHAPSAWRDVARVLRARGHATMGIEGSLEGPLTGLEEVRIERSEAGCVVRGRKGPDAA